MSEAEIAQADLHALVDDQLPPERRRAVEDWLALNPQMAATVSGWRAQNQAIRALFATDLESDGAADRNRLRALRARLVRPRSRWLPAAAAVLLFAIGIATGTLATRALQEPRPVRSAPSLPEASRDSFAVYSAEVARPVEVGPDRQEQLIDWLGKRLGTSLAAPDLSALGLHLLGGRLVPVGAAPGALLIYEDASGARLTWLIVRDPTDRTDTGFRYAERSGVGTFYWLDDGFGYALSAVMPRERLLDIATAVYDQI